MSMDKEIVQALFESLGNMNPFEMANMLKGQTLSFKASFEGIPLDIALKFKSGEILARVKFPQEEKQEDGDQPESG